MSFLLRRALLAIPSLFGLLVITFLMIHVSPADPAAKLAGDNATPEQIARIRHQYGLDQPLAVQFVRYLGDVARLDFGDSQYSGRPVAADLLSRLPATLELSVVALILATAIGIPLGTVAAVHHNAGRTSCCGCCRWAAWRSRRSGWRSCCRCCSRCGWTGCRCAAG